MEAELVGSTLPEGVLNSTYVNQIANAALAGGMVMHIFAAILAFFSAFFLIRYKLTIAKQEERRVESEAVGSDHPSARLHPRDLELGDVESEHHALASSPEEDPGMPAIFSSDPHLEQVGPFRRGKPPTHLLEHCHTLCMWLAAGGFVLALIGVGGFAWSRLARSGSVFALGCLLVCVVASLTAFFWPASSAHTR